MQDVFKIVIGFRYLCGKFHIGIMGSVETDPSSEPRLKTPLPQVVNLSIMEVLDEALAKEMRPPKSDQKDKEDGS